MHEAEIFTKENERSELLKRYLHQAQYTSRINQNDRKLIGEHLKQLEEHLLEVLKIAHVNEWNWVSYFLEKTIESMDEIEALPFHKRREHWLP
jgi:hypothetical protein